MACWRCRPGWYFVPVCLIALIGGMSTGTTALYGTGLDFSSVFPRFSRVQATVFIGAIAIAFIFVGRFAFNVVQSISTFAVLIVTCTAPWMVVMMIGWVVRRGWYDSDALQVFNRSQRGGRYWFSHGWNWRGLGAWLVSAGLSSASSTCPTSSSGRWAISRNGIDLSIPVGLGAGRGALPRAAVRLPRAGRCVRPGRAAVRAGRDPLRTSRSPPWTSPESATSQRK